MPDPIVPPTPTVYQPSNAPPAPIDTSPGMDAVQRAFDTAYPDVKPSKTPTESPPAPASTPTPATPPTPESPTPPAPAEEHKLPSFLEDALKADAPSTPPTPQPDPDEEFPDDLPPEQKQSRIKGLREAYKKLKTEVSELRNQPSRDPIEQRRLLFLENQNKQMSEMLSRVGVEHSQEFQQKIIAPLTGSWNEAVRIVAEAGADPNQLAAAMSLQGRQQFEALDQLFAEMPESAKTEANDALRTYRRYEDARQRAVANAPKTLETIRERESARQYQELQQQRTGMAQMFDRALTRLRDEAKVEVFMKTDDPQTKWWNDQGDQLIEQGRQLFLENTDMDKVALACLLAPTADAYRKLFIKSQQKVSELNKIIRERLGNEPTLSESGGNAGNLMPEGQMKEDLKQPFAQVFLREYHKSQARNR
jgi:hypothetical protein